MEVENCCSEVQVAYPPDEEKPVSFEMAQSIDPSQGLATHQTVDSGATMVTLVESVAMEVEVAKNDRKAAESPGKSSEDGTSQRSTNCTHQPDKNQRKIRKIRIPPPYHSLLVIRGCWI